MENALMYNAVGLGGMDFVVRERTDRPGRTFDRKIEDYVKQLRIMEGRSDRLGVHDPRLLVDLVQLNDGMLAECTDFERQLSDESEISAARVLFRQRTHDILGKSGFISHARTWPRGHQGDHMILEYAYRNMPISGGIGYYLDLYCLQTTLCDAVRHRKDALEELLRRELNSIREPRVLDIACGSCRDVFELAPDITQSNAHVICLDFDADALDFSANRLALSGIRDGQLEFRQYNAFRMINHERNLKEFGSQDLIYSVGFFDYLQDEVLIRLFSALYRLLNPGGKLIMSFKDTKRYSAAFYHWMVDWNGFSQRTEEDCWLLMHKAGIPAGSIEFSRDRSEVIMFFTASR